MANSPEVNRRSGTAFQTSSTASPDRDNQLRSKIPKAEYANEYNVLHKFRSFNYLFTLAAVKNDALSNPESLRNSSDYFVIARSYGKNKPINSDSAKNPAAKGLIEGFNSKSPGRFNLYINDVDIETVMGFSNKTNLSMATKINFEIFEPLSINGFMEALQVSSVAAGHTQFTNAPLLLKMEFIGYTTDESGQDTIKKLGKEATRYFVFNITKVDVEMTENGTKYRCQGVPTNELGHGDHNNLKHAIQMEGSSVKEVLQALMSSINNSNDRANQTDQGDDNIFDQYEIAFPSRDANGTYNYSTENTKLSLAKIHSLYQSPGIFAFPDHSAYATDFRKKTEQANTGKKINPETGEEYTPVDPDPPDANKFYKYEANQTVVQFPAKAKITDIISSVVRDSEYGKDIIRGLPDQVIKNQMVEYIHVHLEVIPLNQYSKKLQRPVFKYRYVCLPYNIHYTRIPLYQDLDINRKELENLYVRRKYDYLYTGRNVDIRNFKLTFNSLFYQAYPQGMQKIFSDPSTRVTEDKTGRKIEDKDSNRVITSTLGQSPNGADPRFADVVKVGGNAGVRSYDEYDKLVTAMHQAILDNLDQVSCELEILGDPYFLVTGGMGNYMPEMGDKRGITQTGEAPYFSEDIIVVVEFRSPDDIDERTGYVKFNSNKSPFSGCFRVINVVSKFNEGMFTQRLQLIRIPGQLAQTASGTEDRSTNAGSKPASATTSYTEQDTGSA